MKTLKELLIELNACEDAIKWVGNKTIEQAVPECHRGDWMLWLATKVEIDHRKMKLAKGHCANTVRHLMKDPRSIKAVDTAIAYGEGNATKEQLATAAYAAYDAGAATADNAATAASVAAYPATPHAAYAAASASSAATAAYVAAYAAIDAVDFDAAVDAADAACKQNRMQTADICRKYIGNDIIEKVNMLINWPVNN